MQANEVKIGDYVNISTKDRNTVVGIVEYVYCTDNNIFIRCGVAAEYNGIDLLGLRVKHNFFIPIKDFSEVVSKSDKQSIERFDKDVKRIKDYLNQYFSK